MQRLEHHAPRRVHPRNGGIPAQPLQRLGIEHGERDAGVAHLAVGAHNHVGDRVIGARRIGKLDRQHERGIHDALLVAAAHEVGGEHAGDDGGHQRGQDRRNCRAERDAREQAATRGHASAHEAMVLA
jgi:hypothetical protein